METAANVSPSCQARHGGAAVRRGRGRGRCPGTPAGAGGLGPGRPSEGLRPHQGNEVVAGRPPLALLIA